MEQSERKALGGAVPVSTLGQGDGPQAQSPRRGRKESPRDPVATSSEARDGKPVQLDLFGDAPGYVGPVWKHPLYSVWSAMKQRCFNPKSAPFHRYGARGITVCDEWRGSARAFISWALAHGWQPGLQLDRRDNDGPYAPGNCRFVTCRVNILNRNNTLRLSDGRAAWPQAQGNGVPRSTFKNRRRRGWSADEAAGLVPRGPLRRSFRLADGRPAWPVAQGNGVSRSAFDSRICRGWTPDQAAGIAPAPQRRGVLLSDGRAAVPQAQSNGVSRAAFGMRLRRGWTPDQAAGIAPPPQRRQKAAGQAQPASDGRRRRKTDKPASQPAPGRCGATKQKRGMQDA